MYKLKTHSGAKKRFKFSKTGKIKYWHANKNHILTKKTTKRKRNLRNVGFISKADELAIKKLFP